MRLAPLRVPWNTGPPHAGRKARLALIEGAGWRSVTHLFLTDEWRITCSLELGAHSRDPFLPALAIFVIDKMDNRLMTSDR
jgi:hypothetical protein